MSIQRRRGQPIKVWKVAKRTDNRGNEVKYADELDGPYVVTAAAIPQRSSRGEVPGQLVINVVRLLIPVLPDVELWSRVEYQGKQWDVVTPPSLHYGTKRTRHYSIDIRERPNG